MGALVEGMQSDLAIWQERRHHGHDDREISEFDERIKNYIVD